MGKYKRSVDEDGGSPPSPKCPNFKAEAEAHDNEHHFSGNPCQNPGSEAFVAARNDGNAKPVDVAFLIDGGDRASDVIHTLRRNLYMQCDAVWRRHPQANVNVAFISYHDHDRPLVADFKPLGSNVLKELPHDEVLRRPDNKCEQADDVLLRGMKCVPLLGWSARHRLLVLLGSEQSPRTLGRRRDKSGSAGGGHDDDSRVASSWASVLRRLGEECFLQVLTRTYVDSMASGSSDIYTRLQVLYFTNSQMSALRLTEELREDVGTPEWLVSELLDDPEALPYKVVGHIVRLLDRETRGSGAAAIIAEEVPESTDVVNPDAVDPTELPRESDGPPGSGARPPSRSASPSTSAIHHTVTMPPPDIESGQSLNLRYLRGTQQEEDDEDGMTGGRGDSDDDSRRRSEGDGTGRRHSSAGHTGHSPASLPPSKVPASVGKAPTASTARTVTPQISSRSDVGSLRSEEEVRISHSSEAAASSHRSSKGSRAAVPPKPPSSSSTSPSFPGPGDDPDTADLKSGTRGPEAAAAVVTAAEGGVGAASSVVAVVERSRRASEAVGAEGNATSTSGSTRQRYPPPPSPPSERDWPHQTGPSLSKRVSEAAGSGPSSSSGSARGNLGPSTCPSILTILSCSSICSPESSGGGGIISGCPSPSTCPNVKSLKSGPGSAVETGSAQAKSKSSLGSEAASAGGVHTTSATANTVAASSIGSSRKQPPESGSSVAVPKSRQASEAGSGAGSGGRAAPCGRGGHRCGPPADCGRPDPTATAAAGCSSSWNAGAGAGPGRAALFLRSRPPPAEASAAVAGSGGRGGGGGRASRSPRDAGRRSVAADSEPVAPRNGSQSEPSLAAPSSLTNHDPKMEALNASSDVRGMHPSRRRGGNSPFAVNGIDTQASTLMQPLPWSTLALEHFKSELRRTPLGLMELGDEPLTARMDAVFAMPPELWPVLPPGALYCLEAFDPRLGFGYLQHRDFPIIRVRVATYFGKWGRHLADYVVSWQPTPRAEAAWQLAADGKQPPLPWEPRQVVAHTTSGEYQYANTRMRFRGPRSTRPDSEMVEWSDAHGVDLPDTKAAHEAAPRNSDKDREAHLIDPPRPNTWGELARRPLISNLRARGGGAYVHHVNYDHSGLRTSCGRRVPAGYFFTLAPNVTIHPPAVPGGVAASGVRTSRSSRPSSAVLQSRGCPPSAASASAAATGASSVDSPLRGFGRTSRAASRPPSAGPPAATKDTSSGGGWVRASARRPPSTGPRRPSSRVDSVASSSSSSASSASGSRLLGAAGLLVRQSSGTGRQPLHQQETEGVAPSATPPLTKIGWGDSSSGGGGCPQQAVPSAAAEANSAATRAAPEASGARGRSPTLTGLDVVSLVRKDHWTTYDVPFNHPIHSTRPQQLATEFAKAAGRRGVRSFSDAAAVLQVSEQELRLPRPFVPGPVVVPHWDDIPRLYGEHMEAARALMPVTELDNYGSSTLHMLLYHLECAATLEYDRLDAKLLLLPQMARLGKKSAEVDAWLQALVEQASYLYERLEIANASRWGPASPAAAGKQPGSSPGDLRQQQQPPAQHQQLMRRSITTLSGPKSATASARTNPRAAAGTSSGFPRGPSQGGDWVFPDPLRGTAHAAHSRVNAAAQSRPPLRGPEVRAARVTEAEWAAVAGVMDPTRHATLCAAWARLRPLMFGTAAQPAGSDTGSRSRGGDVGGGVAVSSDAEATWSGRGEARRVSHSLELLTAPGSSPAHAGADPYLYHHGAVNRELLDCMQLDLAAQSSPDNVPANPPSIKVLRHRGYRGEGPLPPELAAEMPTVQRPVRCRGADEARQVPLPAAFDGIDIWNIRTKAEMATSLPGSPRENEEDEGATRFSQVAVTRLQAAREFAATRRAEVRRSMQRSRGVRTFDEPDAPYYGSDVADDKVMEDGEDGEEEEGEGRCGGPVQSPTSTGRWNATAAGAVVVVQRPDSTGDGFGTKSCSPRPVRGPGGGAGSSGNSSDPPQRHGSSRGSGGVRAPRRSAAACTATQTPEDPREITEEARAREEKRCQADADAAESQRRLLRGIAGKSREEILDEALRSAEAAIRSLNHRPPPSRTAPGSVSGSSSGFHLGHWDPIDPLRTPRYGGADSPALLFVPEEPGDAALQPLPRGRPRIQHSHPEVLPNNWYLRAGGDSEADGADPKGPEPFSLEKILRDSTDGGAASHLGSFGELGSLPGFGGLVDFEVAMARRRAIAAAEVVHLHSADVLTKAEVFSLLVVYCNLDRHPHQVTALQRAVDAPLSTRALKAETKAAAAAAGAGGARRAALSARQAELDEEAVRQRIRNTAWILGVTWRRITNETYTSFLCRVLGWPAELAGSLHRTKATQYIAKALVLGHNMQSVPQAQSRT